MSNVTVGKIIENLRIRKNYSRRKLCQGLCSTQMLIKIETNQSDIDKILADILIQRLGKSPDKLEIILSDEEYSKIHIRDEIEEFIWKRERDKAEDALRKYEALYAKNSNIHKMFVLRTKAYISQELDKDWERAEGYIRQAVGTTLPGVKKENLNDYLLSTIELENILELGNLILKQGREQEAIEIIELCHEYIESNVTDGVEYTKIISKTAWLNSLIYVRRKEYKKAFELCQKAFESLRKYGNLYFMMPLLEQLMVCSEAMGKENDRKKYQNFYDIIEKLYAEYGERWYCHNSIFHNCCQTVYHLASEFIRQERHAKKMTQEQLIEGVYEAPENLSRIEGGKASPTRKKFEGLMKNLGIERGKYCGTLAVEDFEILELKYEMDILIGSGKYDEAQKKLSELRCMIDCDDGMNAMVIEIYQVSIELNRKLVDGKMKLVDIEKSLELLLERSGLLINKKIYRVPFFNEMTVLNMLAICLKRGGNKSAAIGMYEDVVRSAEESEIDVKYQNDILSLILANLDLYNPNGEGVRKAIAYELRCGKGKAIHMHMVALLELIDDKNAKRERARLAYYLSELFYIEIHRQQLKDYYEKTFGKQVSV